MSQSVQQQIPARTSSKKANPQIIAGETSRLGDPELDDNVRDMDYLGPLVSDLNIKDSRGSESQAAGIPSTTQFATSSPKTAKVIPRAPPGYTAQRVSLEKPLPNPPAAGVSSAFGMDNLPAHPGVRPIVKPQARPEKALQRPKIPATDQQETKARSPAAGVPTNITDIRPPATGVDSKDTPNRSTAPGVDLTDDKQRFPATGVDLQNSVDTTVYTTWAPAVTKERIIPTVREVEEHKVIRDHHFHHVYHRVLPIKDIEVLPARHYMETDGRLREVSEKELPATATKDVDKLIAERFKSTLPKGGGISGPRQFTARDFPGAEGDYKEIISPDGSKRTERWWVHPPTLDTRAKESGQTRPFHLYSPNPAEDGFRDEK